MSARRPRAEERRRPHATPPGIWPCCRHSTRPLPAVISSSLLTTLPATSVGPFATGWHSTRASSTPSFPSAPPGSTSSKAGGASFGAKPLPAPHWPTRTISPMPPASRLPSSIATPAPGSGDVRRRHTVCFAAVSCIVFEERCISEEECTFVDPYLVVLAGDASERHYSSREIIAGPALHRLLLRTPHDAPAMCRRWPTHRLYGRTGSRLRRRRAAGDRGRPARRPREKTV